MIQNLWMDEKLQADIRIDEQRMINVFKGGYENDIRRN